LLAARNYRPIELPSEADIPTSFPKLLEQHPAHKFIVVGADVMDGYYSPHFSASTIIMADLAARAGVDSSILGFSFNASAHKKLKPFFDELHSDVKVNLRDAFSLRRFRKFTTCDGQIVADSAFLLKPSSAPADASAWIRSRKENGDTVVGINIHPMLFRHTTADQLNMIIGRFSAALCKATIEMKVSFFLLPHDYRDSSGDGDGIVLRPVLQKIEQEFPDRIFYLEGQHRAADLKATAGLLDGIITARMHLAIAALGMGVPIMCFTYQDKFEGLFDHFELDADMLIDPRVFIEGTRFDEEIKSFIKNIPLLREKIRERLPEVTRLAELNFR
jgi:polysaccharide pyruvyl transferase WcaK-like protein